MLPALGIGDGLLMMIASHHLKKAGYHVTTFHDPLPELASWFPGQCLSPLQNPTTTLLSSFDLIVVENDNSPRIATFLKELRPIVSMFYPTYSPHKHAPLTPNDFVFDPNLPMAENIGKSIGTLLQLKFPSKNNGIAPPVHLTHRKYVKRVILHPFSRETAKNWLLSSYFSLAKKLCAKGFSPIFCMSPQERLEWKCDAFESIDFPNLGALAAFVYESGFVIGNDSLLGHLGSNLDLPTVTIASDEKRMRLWRPDWKRGQLALPPWWLPPSRFKNTQWRHFISPRKVLNRFEEIFGAP